MPAFGKAWNDIITGCVTETNVAQLSCLPAVFQNVVTAALTLAGVVAVFMIIYSGIKFITSGGDAKQVEGARNTLTWAVIGLLVILLSFFIINIIATVFPNARDLITKFGFPSP